MTGSLFGSVRLLLAVFVLHFAFPAALHAKEPYVILLPGSGGNSTNDFLVRNRNAFAAGGLKTEVTTSTRSAIQLARRRSASNAVFIVAMSKGTNQLADVIAADTPLTGAVFVAGNYTRILKKIGDPQKLPKTLIVHSASDKCKKTPPGLARRFVGWSKGKTRLAMIRIEGGQEKGDVCGPSGGHGFYRMDDKPIGAIIRFIKSN